MADEIKTAMEIAREKLEKIGTPTEEERLSWKYIPEGEKLAARFLKENVNLVAELSRHPENARKHVVKGATDILLRNIDLPRTDIIKRNTKKAMDGVKLVKNDKVAVENVYSRLRRIFDHYATQGMAQKKDAYESLRADFEAKIQQAVKQQMGTTAGMRINVESQPQFQEEWRKLQVKLDMQYIKLMDEYKQELAAIN